MKTRGLVSLLVFFFLPAAAQESLPVRKVVLYKNGMGYFEHLAEVRNAQSLEIALPSAQLNDVLKSLTVIDLQRGPVAAVTYDSTAPLDRRLAELPVKVDSSQGVLDFLNKIRGTEIEARTPAGPLTGKLVSAELRRRQVGEYTVRESIELVVFTAQGELRTVELTPATALRLGQKELAADVGRYLELLDSAHQRAVRRLKIHAPGTGARRLHVSYTSEAPIWKTTYRLVLDSKQRPLLQGWAIVDNTTSTDWVNVDLSLVTGAPVSFIQNLSQPLYARRPVVPLPEGLQVTPQMHEAMLETPQDRASISGLVKDPSGAVVPGATVSAFDSQTNTLRQASTNRDGRYRLEVPPGSYRVQASHSGFNNFIYNRVTVSPGRVTALDFTLQMGAVTESIEVTAEVPQLNTDSATVGSTRRSRRRAADSESEMAAAPLPVGELIRQQAPAATHAQALAEQFEYKLRQPVTIRRNQSALLPIVHAEVEGEKVTLYNESTTNPHPRLGVWLKNTSGLTLDSGSFTVIDSNAFAGEGLTEIMSPQERRVLTYALDLSVEISTHRGSQRDRVERVEIARGVMRLDTKLVETKAYTIRNNEQKPRVVLLEHPARPNWKLVETPAPAESTARYHRFRVEVAPKTTAEFVVHEENVQASAYALSDLTPEQIRIWVQQRVLDAELQRLLQGIVAAKNQIRALQKKLEGLEEEEEQIDKDQSRLRENLAKLGNSKEESGLRQRYVRQLDQQEDRLAQIRADLVRLELERNQALQQLNEQMQNLSLERKL